MKAKYSCDSIVWTKIATNWWPGIVTTLDKCPHDFTKCVKREPLLVVKFFNEQEFFDVHRQDSVQPYHCHRKNDFIKRSLKCLRSSSDEGLAVKFEADVKMAEKLTGGNVDIIDELFTTKSAKYDFDNLDIDTPKASRIKYDSAQKEGFTNIGELIVYKKCLSSSQRSADGLHKMKILEQPKAEGDMKSDSSWYKCYRCGYTCSRLNVIIWHNKVHLNCVVDYDSGIKVPGKRKRKQSAPQNRSQKKAKKSDEFHKNGDVEQIHENGHRAEDLLLDWQDEDEVNCIEEITESNHKPTENGFKEKEGTDVEDNRLRVLVAEQDMNSAFDALLAQSVHSVVQSDQPTNYVNNDSDSDSDWQKDSDDSDLDSERGAPGSPKVWPTKNEQPANVNGDPYLFESPEKVEDMSKDFSYRKDIFFKNKEESKVNRLLDDKEHISESINKVPLFQDSKNKKRLDNTLDSDSCSNNKEPFGSPLHNSASYSKNKELFDSPTQNSTSISNDKYLDVLNKTKPCSTKHLSLTSDRLSQKINEESKKHSLCDDKLKAASSSVTSVEKASTSTDKEKNPTAAYMLVAVDNQDNSDSMNVLTKEGKHLAVEASLEDGSTRTLYFDPAQLGPNVDLNNLMLHIDNSGQETVIIPTSGDSNEVNELREFKRRELSKDHQ